MQTVESPCKNLFLNTQTVFIYIDGSYHKDSNTSGYAFAAFEKSTRILVHQESGALYNKTFTTIQNTACEVYAAMKAVAWAVANGYTTINLYYDFAGVRTLTRPSELQHRHQFFNIYREFMSKYLNIKNGVQPKVYLHKVKAHSGVFGNEVADRLAWTAVVNSWRLQKTNPWYHLLKKWCSLFTHSVPALKLKINKTNQLHSSLARA